MSLYIQQAGKLSLVQLRLIETGHPSAIFAAVCIDSFFKRLMGDAANQVMRLAEDNVAKRFREKVTTNKFRWGRLFRDGLLRVIHGHTYFTPFFGESKLAVPKIFLTNDKRISTLYDFIEQRQFTSIKTFMHDTFQYFDPNECIFCEQCVWDLILNVFVESPEDISTAIDAFKILPSFRAIEKIAKNPGFGLECLQVVFGQRQLPKVIYSGWDGYFMLSTICGRVSNRDLPESCWKFFWEPFPQVLTRFTLTFRISADETCAH